VLANHRTTHSRDIGLPVWSNDFRPDFGAAHVTTGELRLFVLLKPLALLKNTEQQSKKSIPIKAQNRGQESLSQVFRKSF